MSSNNDYEVGYGKPPKNTQFKKGQSGNSKGRPSKTKNTLTILTAELDKTVVLKENGKEVKLTKRQAMLRHMVNKAVQGDSKAMFFVFNQLLELDKKVDDTKAIASPDSLSDEDIKVFEKSLNILAEYRAKQDDKRQNESCLDLVDLTGIGVENLNGMF